MSFLQPSLHCLRKQRSLRLSSNRACFRCWDSCTSSVLSWLHNFPCSRAWRPKLCSWKSRRSNAFWCSSWSWESRGNVRQRATNTEGLRSEMSVFPWVFYSQVLCKPTCASLRGISFWACFSFSSSSWANSSVLHKWTWLGWTRETKCKGGWQVGWVQRNPLVGKTEV